MILILKSKLIFILPLMVGGLALGNITATNLVATTGQDIPRLNRQIQELTQTNTKLRQALAQKSSLTYLLRQAETLGFTSPQTVVYLKAGSPLARR